LETVVLHRSVRPAVHHGVPLRIMWTIVPGVLAAQLDLTLLQVQSHPAALSLLGRLGRLSLVELLVDFLDPFRVREVLVAELTRHPPACLAIQESLEEVKRLVESLIAFW
jgi:hypothetical protein